MRILTTIKDLLFDFGMLIVVGIFMSLLFGDLVLLVILIVLGEPS